MRIKTEYNVDAYRFAEILSGGDASRIEVLRSREISFIDSAKHAALKFLYHPNLGWRSAAIGLVLGTTLGIYSKIYA